MNNKRLRIVSDKFHFEKEFLCTNVCIDGNSLYIEKEVKNKAYGKIQ